MVGNAATSGRPHSLESLKQAVRSRTPSNPSPNPSRLKTSGQPGGKQAQSHFRSEAAPVKMAQAPFNAHSFMMAQVKNTMRNAPNLIKTTGKTDVEVISSAKKVSEEDRKAFQDFLHDFGKTYSEENEEFGMRLAVFAQTRRRVAKMQAEGMKWAGITQFADMTTEERKQILMSGDAVNKMAGSARKVLTIPESGSNGRTKRQTPPSSFDYRTYGWVTSIKQQGIYCGSCWAFSTMALMETVYLKYWKDLNDFSEQDLVDCATDNLGCNGGNVAFALNYISQNRTTHEIFYPYQGVKQTCDRSISKSVKATKYFQLTDESSIASFIYNTGPVSFLFTVKSDLFEYASSVYDASECSDTSATFQGWHYMVIVGFTPSYWIAKNSWGTHWGNAGYAYFARGKNLCKMNTQMLCAHGELYGK